LWDGLLLLEVGEHEKATKTLLRTLELCHELDASKDIHQTVLNNLAVALMRQERWKEALEFLDEALALGSPEFPDLASNREACLEHLSKAVRCE
jgi:tetratricopeptide (TPR) repeat protein